VNPAEVGDLANRLHSLAIHVLRSVREADPATGLTPSRLSALSVVVYAGPLAMGALAEAEQVKPPTMTRLVQALESESLVTRVTDAGDARLLLVRATARGRRVLEQARERRVRVLASRLESLTAEELEDAARAAAALERVFGGPRV
jgi:DNA-binding MarR family transcriptional regulator